MVSSLLLAAAGIAGAIGIASGAFASHGLEEQYSETALSWMETASRYLLWHAPMLALCSLLSTRTGSKIFPVCGFLFFVGVFLFSGNLLLRAFLEIEALSFLIPIGGSILILAWCGFLVGGVIGVFSRKSA